MKRREEPRAVALASGCHGERLPRRAAALARDRLCERLLWRAVAPARNCSGRRSLLHRPRPPVRAAPPGSKRGRRRAKATARTPVRSRSCLLRTSSAPGLVRSTSWREPGAGSQELGAAGRGRGDAPERHPGGIPRWHTQTARPSGGFRWAIPGGLSGWAIRVARRPTERGKYMSRFPWRLRPG